MAQQPREANDAQLRQWQRGVTTPCLTGPPSAHSAAPLPWQCVAHGPPILATLPARFMTAMIMRIPCLRTMQMQFCRPECLSPQGGHSGGSLLMSSWQAPGPLSSDGGGPPGLASQPPEATLGTRAWSTLRVPTLTTQPSTEVARGPTAFHHVTTRSPHRGLRTEPSRFAGAGQRPAWLTWTMWTMKIMRMTPPRKKLPAWHAGSW